MVKLLNNVLAAANLVSVGEALGVAKAYGIDPATAAASISEASGGSKVSANMYPNWVLTGTHDSGFSLGLMARDAALAVDVAAQIGENPALLAAVAGQWQDALAVLGPARRLHRNRQDRRPGHHPRRRTRHHARTRHHSRRLSPQPPALKDHHIEHHHSTHLLLGGHRPGSPGRRLPGRPRRLP